MLQRLYIRNFALIRELEIELDKGMSVITGETGAGKSIILGAISLLLGQKADARSILSGTEKCTVEGTFSIRGRDIEGIFQDNELDYDPEECVIRREITKAGKSRAFVNDTPVNLSTLKLLACHLIDIHSQHQNLLLGDEDYQLGVVDVMAQDTELLDKYRSAFKAYKQTEQELRMLAEEVERNRKEQDYMQFQLEQLEALSPKDDEDESLRRELDELSHAEEIKTVLYQTAGMLSNDSDEGGVVEQMRHIANQLGSISPFFKDIDEALQRTESALIEMKDICSDLSSMAEGVEFSPERLEAVSQRLDMLYTLEQKHGAASSTELKALMEDLRRRLDAIADGESGIAALHDRMEGQEREAKALAEQLSATRCAATEAIEQYMAETLMQLDMPNVRFKVRMDKQPEMNPNGTDTATFLFSANRQTDLQRISQVASGGEIARVMLALKSMVGKRKDLPTIIFDEIDTGVSGKAADSMGMLMEGLCNGSDRQVIVITHLPQIASKGSSHYWVYKDDEEGQTLSHIRKLDPEERVMEIAHMLSGNTMTEAAIENARQLLAR